jgi:TonB family protein
MIASKMNILSLTLAWTLLSIPASLAQVVSQPTSNLQDVQTRAEALLSKARQVSDIRSQNAPGFHLKATFSFTGGGLETKSGTYDEIWISHSQWQRETIVGQVKGVEVGVGNRLWQLDSPTDLPDQAASISAILSLFPRATAGFKFDSVRDQPSQGIAAECALTKPAFRGAVFSFCFDKNTGVLFQKEAPDPNAQAFRVLACEYGSFRRFGEHRFPWEAVCSIDGQNKIDVKVVDLELDPAADSSLFSAPAGALELANCSTKLIPPRATSFPGPVFAPGVSKGQAGVTIGVVVDTEGKPQKLKIIESGGKSADEAALKAVREWRFDPATCDGEAVPARAQVRVDFHLFR